MNQRCFAPVIAAFPWNVVDLAISLPPIDLTGALILPISSICKYFREITGFRNPQSFQRLDHISVADWVAEDFPRGSL
jgi:isorenieratene synthase